VAVNDGAFKAPSRQWQELMSSSDLIDEDIFRPDDVLFPDMPQPWGGLGTELCTFEQFRPERAIFLRLSRPLTEYSSLSVDRLPLPTTSIRNGVFEVQRLHPLTGRLWSMPEIQVTSAERRPVTGWVSRQAAKQLAITRFGVNVNKFRWTAHGVKAVPTAVAWREAVLEAARLGDRAKGQMYKEYVEAFLQGAAGNTWVEDVDDLTGTLVIQPRLGEPSRAVFCCPEVDLDLECVCGLVPVEETAGPRRYLEPDPDEVEDSGCVQEEIVEFGVTPLSWGSTVTQFTFPLVSNTALGLQLSRDAQNESSFHRVSGGDLGVAVKVGGISNAPCSSSVPRALPCPTHPVPGAFTSPPPSWSLD